MRDKYKDEIEEILKGLEEEPPSSTRRSQPALDDLPAPTEDTSRGSSGQSGLSSRWQAVTPGRLALAGLVMLALGLLLPIFGLPMRWLIWLGLLTLAGAYLLFFVRPRPRNRDKVWRGRSLEAPGPSPWQRFKAWFRE